MSQNFLDLGYLFWPIFGQADEAFFAVTVISLFDENTSNQFYIRISVVFITWIFFFGGFILSLINVYSIRYCLGSIF